MTTNPFEYTRSQYTVHGTADNSYISFPDLSGNGYSSAIVTTGPEFRVVYSPLCQYDAVQSLDHRSANAADKYAERPAGWWSSLVGHAA